MNAKLDMSKFSTNYNNFDEFCKYITSIPELLLWFKSKENKMPIERQNKAPKRIYWPDEYVKIRTGVCYDFVLFVKYFCDRFNIDYKCAMYQVIFVSKDHIVRTMGHALIAVHLPEGWYTLSRGGPNPILYCRPYGPYATCDEAIKIQDSFDDGQIKKMKMAINSQGDYPIKFYNKVYRLEWDRNSKLDKLINSHYNKYTRWDYDIFIPYFIPMLKEKYKNTETPYPDYKEIPFTGSSTNKNNEKMNPLEEFIFQSKAKFMVGMRNLTKKLFEYNESTMQEGLAGINPVMGIKNTLYVGKMYNPGYLRPRYIIQNDLMTDKLITTNKDNKLVSVPTNELLNNKIQLFKYKGKDPNAKLMSILNSVGTIVNREYIYETVSGKELLTDDQIEYDEDFQYVDFDAIKAEIENESYSFINKYIFTVKPELTNKYKIITTNEAQNKIFEYPELAVILDESLGYFITNKNTFRRTKYYDNISDIMITPDLLSKEG